VCVCVCVCVCACAFACVCMCMCVCLTLKRLQRLMDVIKSDEIVLDQWYKRSPNCSVAAFHWCCSRWWSTTTTTTASTYIRFLAKNEENCFHFFKLVLLCTRLSWYICEWHYHYKEMKCLGQPFIRPGVNFINILRAGFLYESKLRIFSLITIRLGDILAKGYLWKKACVKFWWKWPQVSISSTSYRQHFYQYSNSNKITLVWKLLVNVDEIECTKFDNHNDKNYSLVKKFNLH